MAFDPCARAMSVVDAAACEDKLSEGMELCPFLRNLGLTTNFSFFKLKFPVPAPTRAGRGPIFEDGPGFESSFRLFHGKDGVVPLKRASEETGSVPDAAQLSFHPLSASAAAISLSPFGPAGPFGFDSFMESFNAKKKKPSKRRPKKENNNNPEKKEHKSNMEAHMHEAMSSEWLATGQCPIAKSFRAVSGALPLVSKLLLTPATKGMMAKYRCPPAIVAARAALARAPAVKALRPQALPTKVLAIGVLGMALNVPLGMWREHTKKFSPQWFLAVHATIPFIAMLRKAVVMPKYAIAFTIGSAVLGQAVGARAERLRLANLPLPQLPLPSPSPSPSLSPSPVSVEVLSANPYQRTTVNSHSQALPALSLSPSPSPVLIEALLPNSRAQVLPELANQATTAGVSSEVDPRFEKLPAEEEHRLPAWANLLTVSPPESLLERKSFDLTHGKQQQQDLSQLGVSKRLLQSPLQCGSEVLGSCSLGSSSSSSSQPALVS